MAIKARKCVIDDAVLELLGDGFKFDPAKGLADWLNKASEAYLREQTPDDRQFIIARLTEDSSSRLTRIECMYFVGITRTRIDDAFRPFFDPRARRVTEPLAMLPSARLATGQNRHHKLYSIPESGQ